MANPDLNKINSLCGFPAKPNPIGGNGLALTKAQWDIFFKNMIDINLDVQKADS